MRHEQVVRFVVRVYGVRCSFRHLARRNDGNGLNDSYMLRGRDQYGEFVMTGVIAFLLTVPLLAVVVAAFCLSVSQGMK